MSDATPDPDLAVTGYARDWRYDGYSGGIAESLVLVDGAVIGGVYRASYNPAQEVGWGYDDGGESGDAWISWGPNALSAGHATREAAERAQAPVLDGSEPPHLERRDEGMWWER